MSHKVLPFWSFLCSLPPLVFSLKLFSLARFAVSLVFPSGAIMMATECFSLLFVSWACFVIHFSLYCGISAHLTSFPSVFSSHVLTLLFTKGAHCIIRVFWSSFSLSHIALSALEMIHFLYKFPKLEVDASPQDQGSWQFLQRRSRSWQCNPGLSSSEESVPVGAVSQPSLLASSGFSAWWLNQQSPRLHLCGQLGVTFSFVLRFVALLWRGSWHAEITVAPSQMLLYVLTPSQENAILRCAPSTPIITLCLSAHMRETMRCSFPLLPRI